METLISSQYIKDTSIFMTCQVHQKQCINPLSNETLMPTSKARLFSTLCGSSSNLGLLGSTDLLLSIFPFFALFSCNLCDLKQPMLFRQTKHIVWLHIIQPAITLSEHNIYIKYILSETNTIHKYILDKLAQWPAWQLVLTQWRGSKRKAGKQPHYTKPMKNRRC